MVLFFFFYVLHFVFRKFPLLLVCFFCPLFPFSLFLSAKRLQLYVVILLLCIFFSPTRPLAHSPPHTNINLAIYLQSVDLSLLLIRWRFFPFKYLCLNLHSASFLRCLRSFLVFQFLYPKSCPP